MTTSERQKKRIISQGLRELKSKAGWDPSNFRSSSASSRLRDNIERQRTLDCLQQSDQCPACLALRASGDTEALCETHLREAMLGPGSNRR
jgi:hypothetical protein